MEQMESAKERISPIDEDIARYIERTPGNDYAEAIRDDRRFEVFYHLSDLRAGLFGWYDFRPQASLLEVGAEFGALTGMLCQKCADVVALEVSAFRAEAIKKRYPAADNLSVRVGGLDALDSSERFDYIVVSKEFETAGQGQKDLALYAEYVKKLRAHLKPDGVLLIAVTNRYGLKYFCGEAEPHAKKPFAGISGRMRGAKGRSFSRNELVEIFQRAGVPAVKFYYPLPDHILPQLVYTDDYLPEDNLNERLLLYHPDNKTLVADEERLYSDIIKNGVFPFLANSYLVECGAQENLSSAVYAALSTDRGRSKAMATVIDEGDGVTKRPLFSEGEAYVRGLYENAAILAKHDVPMLPHAWDGNGLSMPRVRHEMLSSYLKHCVRENPEEFKTIFDRLWHIILASSEEAPADANAFPEKKDAAWGPILKRASIELIPLNCFYDGREFLFFDQEYVRENYPAKYVLFRALHYTYVFAPETAKYVPLEDLKEKYGLAELWDSFVREENERFLPTVRQHDLYKQFYRWKKIDGEQMERNASLLGLDAEYSPDYVVSDTMRKIWRVGFDLLRVFVDMCRRHDLTYYIYFGTLLGAVRHEGFIPWDDDVDVVMPRADFDKLMLLADEFPAPYFLQTAENDPGTFWGSGMRLRNSNTTGISRQDFEQEANLGIWMDILPLDNCPADRRIVEKNAKNVQFWHSLLTAKVYEQTPWVLPHGLRTVGGFVLRFVPHAWLCAKYRAAIRAGRVAESDYVAVPGSASRIYEKKNFGKGTLLRFGDLRVNAPENYKACLQLTAGRDYMKFPPLSERKPHHLGIFNPDVPYTRYHEIFCGLFEGAKDKTIILFGGGFMFEDYMKKYGRSFPPAFIIDNDRQKWGTKRRGVPIREPESILDMPAKHRHLIICSIHYREIEKQLNKMGIHDYKIYVQEKEWIFADEERGR